MITSDMGRIGLIWWVNGNTTPRTVRDPLCLGLSHEVRLISWGTFGIGKDLRLDLEQCND